MKKYLYTGCMLAGALFATSCEKDIQVYNAPECYLNFDLNTGGRIESSERNYSFVYHGDVTQDTVWLKLTTLGFVHEVNRSFELMQVKTDENDAVEGKHYVSFDNEALKKECYYIPAGAVEVDVPIVVLRDASLKSQEVTLKVAVKENANFKPGYEKNQFITIHLTDQLAKPTAWDNYSLNVMIGPYTKGVHMFCIEATGENWDDTYITSLENSYLVHMTKLVRSEFTKENARRIANGEDVLREENGDPVYIKPL